MYTQLCSLDNLLLAYQRAAKAKRGHPNVAAFEFHLEDNLIALQRELREQTYRPGAYTSFHIHEPKRRLISAAPFRDRVVHHALCNLIEPVFERSFIFDSYANRQDKGTHRALNRCQQFARQYRYVLQCDIKQFFPSIDHAILRATLARKIDDRRTNFQICPTDTARVMWLIDQILASGAGVLSEEYDPVYFPGDDLFAIHRLRGLPIGNLTSQFWANCYLNPFDHFVQRELQAPAYLRYVDDFLIFADDKRWLADARRAIIARLARLRLTIHPTNCKPVTNGISFLGFVVFPEHRRLKQRKGIAFARRLRTMIRQYRAGAITRDQFTASVRGWINHARFANTRGLRCVIAIVKS